MTFSFYMVLKVISTSSKLHCGRSCYHILAKSLLHNEISFQALYLIIFFLVLNAHTLDLLEFLCFFEFSLALSRNSVG